MTATTTAGWTNWFGNQSCSPERVAKPRSEDELRKLVREVSQSGGQLRVVGGGHSLPPVVPTNGVLVDLADMPGELVVDTVKRTARLPAGRKLRSVFDSLWDAGLALSNMGELADGTIAGAVSTGAHGTGLTLPCTSASVVAGRIITPSGEILEVSESDPGLLRAAQVSLGLLGVFTELTLKMEPAYDLYEVPALMETDEVLDNWDGLVAAHRHFSFYFVATMAAGETFAAQLPHLPVGVHDACYATLIDAAEPGVRVADPAEHSRQDRMDRILTIDFDPNYREIEYAVPLDIGRETFIELREMLLRSYPDYSYPINVRFVAGDEAYLSAYAGGPRTVFSVSDHPDAAWSTLLGPVEEFFLTKGGRPHWGKEHSLAAETAAALWPDFDRFVQLRRELDPVGMLLNDHLRDLFG